MNSQNKNTKFEIQYDKYHQNRLDRDLKTTNEALKLQNSINSTANQTSIVNNNTFNAPITQFSQGDHNTQTINHEIPSEILSELINLLKSEKTDRKGWIEWLTKVSSIVGSLSPVVEFISNHSDLIK